MPRRKIRRRATKKKRYVRKRKTNSVFSGFPRETVRTLHYTDYFTLSSSLGVMSYFKLRANSVFDPNFTGLGHQPFGFDQIAQFYNHYQVTASSVKFTATPSNAHPGVPVVTGVYLADDSSTVYSDWTTFVEAKRGTSVIMPPINTESRRFSGSFSKKKFFGPLIDNGNISALVTTNPTEEAYFHVWMQPQDQTSSTTSAINYVVNMTFKVRFFEPKDIVAS